MQDCLIVSVYVDDIIYTSSSKAMVEEFKAQMKGEFDMSDMGILQYFLVLEVQQTKRGIFISQTKYAKELLCRMGMQNCSVVETPMNVNEKLSLEDGEEMVDPTRYISLVGGLIYLTHTRTDIVFPVGMVSRFMHQPSKNHFGAAKRIFKYVAGTTTFRLWYTLAEKVELVGFSDNDWASCIDDRRSISVNVFMFGTATIT